jgi:hypothetical protein
MMQHSPITEILGLCIPYQVRGILHRQGRAEPPALVTASRQNRTAVNLEAPPKTEGLLTGGSGCRLEAPSTETGWSLPTIDSRGSRGRRKPCPYDCVRRKSYPMTIRDRLAHEAALSWILGRGHIQRRASGTKRDYRSSFQQPEINR